MLTPTYMKHECVKMQNLDSIITTVVLNNNDIDLDLSLNHVVLDAVEKLDLYEQRLFSFIVKKTKGKKITCDTRIYIEASEYVEAFGGDIESAHKDIKRACDSIFEREFTFREVTPTESFVIYKTRWVSQVGYNDAEMFNILYLTPAIIRILKTLEEKFINLDD